MKNDYLVIGVDIKKRYSIRFVCLKHAIEESLKIHNPSEDIKEFYEDFLIGSVLLGSRKDEQETSLYKIGLKPEKLIINCEVSARGIFRSALFTQKQSLEKSFFKITQVTKKLETYESVVEVNSSDPQKIFQTYLTQSVQSHSLVHLHNNPINPDKKYGFWIEKLPETPLKEWQNILESFTTKQKIADSIENSDDPDKIFNGIFPDPIEVLAVTQPRIECSCSKERILSALQSLPNEDLVDIFMNKQGIETKCEYCGKTWNVSDKEIQQLLKGPVNLQ